MIKLTTVCMTAQTTPEFVDLLMLLSNAENPSLHNLLEPFNELIWKQDDAPSVAILVHHEMEDGSEQHAIGMSFKGVDYLIHNYDVTPQRSVEKIKTWFPNIKS